MRKEIVVTVGPNSFRGNEEHLVRRVALRPDEAVGEPRQPRPRRLNATAMTAATIGDKGAVALTTPTPTTTVR
jgi:hypothetical protein